MNKLLIATSLLITSLLPIHFFATGNNNDKNIPGAKAGSTVEVIIEDRMPPIDAVQLYKEMELEDIIDWRAFEQAIEGYEKINPEKKEVLTLIDYSKSSKEERMYVLDLKEKQLLFTTHVLHGAKSGYETPTSFSNEVNSNKSSLGFFLAENSYHGKFGYALRLNGLEKGINDKAKERAIVIHGSKYANPKVINSAKRLPRSLGCPAIPYDVNDDIINTIKGGSLVYIYASKANEEYVYKSNILDADSFFG
ncbi:MAG: murein L,D-transpeptidase catalytic domain family protein [Tannerellaceae bacterium]|nr:murein L,D-transpeptidase catalytic domain family protein [Tannerellaceae bacterium]